MQITFTFTIVGHNKCSCLGSGSHYDQFGKTAAKEIFYFIHRQLTIFFQPLLPVSRDDAWVHPCGGPFIQRWKRQKVQRKGPDRFLQAGNGSRWCTHDAERLLLWTVLDIGLSRNLQFTSYWAALDVSTKVHRPRSGIYEQISDHNKIDQLLFLK